MDVARLAGIRSPVTNAGAPAPARPPLQPGPAPLCQPLAEQLQVMSNAGYLGEAHLRAFGVVSTAEEFPEFVVGYRHPTRRWPPSSTGGNLNSAGRFRTCQISSAADLGGVGLQRDGRLLVVRSRGRDRSSLPGGKFEDREPGTRAHPRGPRRTGPRPHPSAKCAHCAGVGPRPNRRHSAGLPRPHVSNAGRLR